MRATANYRGGEATAGDAKVLFRDDGSAVRLDAMNGFNLVTATGGHMTAPTGAMDFQRAQPAATWSAGRRREDGFHSGDGGRGRSETACGLRLRSSTWISGRTGELRQAHLQGDRAHGVEMHSDAVNAASKETVHVSRTWQSPVADVEFRDNGHGQAEPATIHGVQGVVVTGESQRGSAAPEPSRLAADEVTGEFGANSALTAMSGSGHASVEETNAAGARQTSTGDRLEAHFATPGPAGAKSGVAGGHGGAATNVAGSNGAGSNGAGSNGTGANGPGPGGAGQIQSAVIDGHVVLTQTSAAKPAAGPNSDAPAPLLAWAGRADYDGTGQWLHLTLSPRVEDGGLQMTADKIDVSHESGDAYAHGNVKATWLGSNSATGGASGNGGPPSTAAGHGGGRGTVALGGQGPAHVVSSEAQLHHGQSSSEATFRGHARLWQQSNSVAGAGNCARPAKGRP
jgi:lipopolysaccharide export system protein LptA